jgi:hypothetical protein
MPVANIFTEETRAVAVAQNVDTDASGDTTVTFDSLREIDSGPSVHVQATGGYVANVQSVDGNTVTVRIFESAGSAAALSPVADNSDVTTLYAEATGS